MLKAILADHNLAGHLRALHSRVWLSPEWNEFWQSLAIRIETYESMGLDTTTPDDELWRFCQREGMILFTANRNHDGDTSLDATIRRECTLDSLPVITLSDDQYFWHDPNYSRRVAIEILQVCMDVTRYLGTGRIYVPLS
jgi:hypothetical protein